MSIEIIANDVEVNASSEEQFKQQFDSYVDMVGNKLLAERVPAEKIKDVLSYLFYNFAPGFEEFLVKIMKEKGVDISKKYISPNDRTIFPNGTKDFVKYLKLYVNEIQKGNIVLEGTSSRNKNTEKFFQEFLKIYSYLKPYFVKFMELAVGTVDVINRLARVNVILKSN